MNKRPLVSVIVPFYNSEKFIEETIESVLAQTYHVWELLLIDDGSTDRSSDIALRYVRQYPEKVRYFEHKNHRNRGITAASNVGVRNAKGTYIALLDSDDVWLPRKLEEQVELLEAMPEAGMVFGFSQYWRSWGVNTEDQGSDQVPEIGVATDMIYKPPMLLKLLYPLGEGISPCPSDILVRREIIEAVGGFEEGFRGRYRLYQDQALLSKIYVNTPVFIAGRCWDRHRIHGNSCVSVEKRAGNYYTARLFFLDWLESYLSKQGLEETEVWSLLQQKLRPYRRISLHPILYHLMRQLLSLAHSKESVTGYEGHLDRTDCHMISGWAWDEGRPGVPVYVDIYSDGKLLAVVRADEFRMDLLDAGKGDGRHGFSYLVPYRLKNNKPHSINVKVTGVDFGLSPAPKEIACERETADTFLARLMRLVRRSTSIMGIRLGVVGSEGIDDGQR